VMIAMAMACDPDLLIADEPTTGLDVTVQAEILLLLLGFQQDRGLTLLFITHNVGVVGNPRDGHTRKLLGAVPRMGLGM